MEFALVSGDVDQPQRDAQQSPQEIRLTRNVATQLIEVARALPDRPVEITLNPEELGKLRMTVMTSEGAISVSLLAERAETTELLRRHIEILSQEFQALGYSHDVRISLPDAHCAWGIAECLKYERSQQQCR